MRNKLICLLALFASLGQTARAATEAPVPARLNLTHVAADKWRADYVFSEAINSLQLGPAVAGYRKQAWRVLTPGVALVESDGQESLRSAGKAINTLSLEIKLHAPFALDNYTPMDRFSDGGTDLYIGFLDGEAMQGKRARPLRLQLQLTGLPDESVIAPDTSVPGQSGYAYFGPRTPAVAGVANLILDPGTPAWAVQLLTETTATMTTFYERTFQRKLDYQPLVMVALGDLEAPGLSIKGGLVGKQIVYRLGGKALVGGSPLVRRMAVRVIAHELSHIWQANLARGGIGGTEPWIHEGGAEALALAGLRQTGLYTRAEADAYADQLIAECNTLQGSVDSYRGHYACGFKRFMDYDKDIFALWKAMMETSEAGGAVYSTAMIDALRSRIGKAAVVE